MLCKNKEMKTMTVLNLSKNIYQLGINAALILKKLFLASRIR